MAKLLYNQENTDIQLAGQFMITKHFLNEISKKHIFKECCHG